MLLTQDRSLFMESSMWECGETERQKLNNLISTPLFTSPSLSSLSHLLSFPHVCLLTISPLVHPTPVFPQISSHIFPPIALICSQAPSSLISPLLYPISSTPPCPAPIVTFSLHSPPVSAIPHLSPKSNLQICTHIENMNNFKHFDRKHWNTICSAHKDTHFKPITSFFKQKTGGKDMWVFASFNSTFVEQCFFGMCVRVRACVCAVCLYVRNVGRWDGAR